MNKNEFLNIKSILDSNEFFIKKENIYVDKRLEDYSSNFQKSNYFNGISFQLRNLILVLVIP